MISSIKSSFLVAGKYEVQMIHSPFGLEKYLVDGQEVLKLRSFAIRGSRRFSVGEDDHRKHEVEIKFDMFPGIRS